MRYKYKQEPKKDCRFYDRVKHNCKALNDLYCAIDERPCSFYKSKKEVQDDTAGTDAYKGD